MLVIIPTYNEIDNLEMIVGRVRAAVPRPRSSSPTTTARTAPATSPTSWPPATPHVHVLHRPGKEGLGAAYVAGFGWAAEHGYDAVVEMDADGSHAPEELPKLLMPCVRPTWCSARAGCGAAPWSTGRRTGSCCPGAANLYTRLALGMPIKDATGGYRAYRMPVLEKIDVDAVASQGYCFQVDLAWRAYRGGFRLVEVPIRSPTGSTARAR